MGKVLCFLKSEDGPTGVEYATMCGLIVMVCLGAVTLLGQTTSTKFTSIATTLPAP